MILSTIVDKKFVNFSSQRIILDQSQKSLNSYTISWPSYLKCVSECEEYSRINDYQEACIGCDKNL